MSRDDLENLLRNELSRELDPQRGRAARMFESQVIKPMQASLEKRNRNWYVLRSWSMVATAMAACVVIGYSVPYLITGNQSVPTVVSENESQAIVPQMVGFNAPADYRQTSFKNSVDAGSVMLNNQTPGRKIVLEEVKHFHWNEPSTGGHIEIIEPSQRDLYLPVHQQ